MKNQSRTLRLRLIVALPVLAAGAIGCGSPEEMDGIAADTSALSVPAFVQAMRDGGAALALKDHYIVTLKEGKDQKGMVHAMGVVPSFVYDQALNGFAAYLTPGQVNGLRNHPDVAQVEPDQEIRIGALQTPVTWGLDRIDQRALPLNNTYGFNATGAGVTAYIIDTGISPTHPNFGGRAAVAFDALGGNGLDCNGHGTHVAGTVGSTTWGVAKGVTLRGVRVLDCGGSGTMSSVLAGMNWVTNNHASRSVANMSLGGGYSSTLNNAATAMVNSGVFVAVAAGNNNANASTISPASATGVFTVAASDSTDRRASFSNFGSLVEAYAPGVNITSTWLNGGSNTISGTSMASPHVAGIAALYKGQFGEASGATISNWLITNATANVILSNPAGTPNRLVFKTGI